MPKGELSRRSFFGASAAAALADPGQAAAQAVGVKKTDLPDLTIKEVKVYVANIGDVRRLNGSESGEIVSIVTNSGTEGNMTLGNRGNPPGFLDYAKRRVLGKSALDVTSITRVPNTRRFSAYGALESGRGFAGRPPRALPKPVVRAARRARLRPAPFPPAGVAAGAAVASAAKAVLDRYTSTTPSSTFVCGTSSARR